MIGLIVALYEESRALLSQLSFTRIHSVGQYIGNLQGMPVSLYLCGPGLKKRGQFFKWLKQHRFDRILNIGYAGCMKSGFQTGQACHIQLLKRIGQKNIHLNGNQGNILFTADEVIGINENQQSDHTKKYYFDQTQASLIDMESYKIAETLSEFGFDLSNFDVIKIVDDLLDDESYLNKEKRFRNFFSSKNLQHKVKIIAQTGYYSAWHIYRRKKFLQKQLHNQVIQYLQKV